MDLNKEISKHFIWKDYLKSNTADKMGIDLSDPPQDIIDNIKKVNAKEEEARAVLNRPIDNSCGWRPLAVNKAIGSKDTSAHVEALACDMTVPGMTPLQVIDALAASPTFMIGVDQLIVERGCVHMGLPCKASNYHARLELRNEVDTNGVRHYPLLRVWTPPKQA